MQYDPATHQAGVAKLRNRARETGHTPGRGLINDAGVPTLERPDNLDVARLVAIKRGKTVLLPASDAVASTLDLTRPIRQISDQFGADSIAWMHANADELRSQYRPLLAGQTAAVADSVDGDIAKAFVNLLNGE